VAGKPAGKADSQEPAPPQCRSERRLWYIAIGREIASGVQSGRSDSYSEAARQCGVSRARVSKVVGMQGVAVMDQEKYLRTEDGTAGG